MGSKLANTVVIINVGKIEHGNELIEVFSKEGNNVILDSLPEGTTKEELKEHINNYKSEYLIDEILLLNEASDLLTSKTNTLKK